MTQAAASRGDGVTSIVILSYNTLDYTRLCIESIRTYTEAGTYEILVVDNGSHDGSAEWLKEQADILLFCNAENRGFPGGCNQGMRAAMGDSLLLLNSDTIVTPNWLGNMRRALFSAPDIGAVGCVTNRCSNEQKIPAPYESIEEMETFAEAFNVSDPAKWHPWFMLVGFCFLMKREAYIEVGGFDERFSPGNYEDDDLSVRLRMAGYDLLLLQDTFIHHFGSASFGRKQNVSEAELQRKQEAYAALLQRNAEKFVRKWGVDPKSYRTRYTVEAVLPDELPQGARVTLVGFSRGMELYHLGAHCPEATVVGVIVGAPPEVPLSRRISVRRVEQFADAPDAIEPAQDYIIVRDALNGDAESLCRRLCGRLRIGGKLLVPNGGGMREFSRTS
ncbi:glycosyltransferase family 2 protein [Mitsuokella sp. oral taxon 131]|uniref:glycosyltransferase family 2 protein n=1 Tax=Mitsuokella sp. oral taxon 131 TaxID=1321780 RepID=UPI0003ADD913|nr:glycosyltransferase family 2 protein [Mitsuokella sp. oral taxon 131]ERL03818.1 glycosyltransferase, group 2 family protein [Mitsuokella sp. oral taxon 131 str. W9106]